MLAVRHVTTRRLLGAARRLRGPLGLELAQDLYQRGDPGLYAHHRIECRTHLLERKDRSSSLHFVHTASLPAIGSWGQFAWATARMAKTSVLALLVVIWPLPRHP
jgi:hypothetical protein